MRVITGSARGCGLSAPKGRDTRPTTDRTKENLFNIIAGWIPEAYFLDLFSGTGAIGIEALSRGASQAVFVDNSIVCCEIINKNLLHTNLHERAKVINADFKNALAVCSAEGRMFDIVFMDPPYAKGLVSQATQALLNRKLLKDDGILIAEISAREPLPLLGDNLEVFRTRQYGDTLFIFARKAAIS